MDTKRQVKITIDGTSLTEDEKKKIIDSVTKELNGEQKKDRVIYDWMMFKSSPEVKKENMFKEKIDDIVWNLGVKKGMLKAKWNSMSDSTKLAIMSIGIPALTNSVLAVVNEARLVKKEHRLQKEYDRKHKGS